MASVGSKSNAAAGSAVRKASKDDDNETLDDIISASVEILSAIITGGS